ncbi:hypothetical protein CORMATOL_00971 [Corynebacterium matruchotii ATCC 33806]|uniref:Uncharacterized protein n=1 Tax=Corynebacterium matruchotii ATCC 33806 TaxID=566549 RepID=C0E1W7_9CORY|nr:hypothetical protein CORMATOL_00971 [Corynebacterium matruchotii ATCC 33806]
MQTPQNRAIRTINVVLLPTITQAVFSQQIDRFHHPLFSFTRK